MFMDECWAIEKYVQKINVLEDRIKNECIRGEKKKNLTLGLVQHKPIDAPVRID